MNKDTTIPFTNRAYRDELSELVREGAQRIIRKVVEAELGSPLRNTRTRVTYGIVTRCSATATCLRGKC